MGTITAQQIADRAWTKALEATGSSATRWTPAEALWWINDGQREIVHQLPKANAVRAVPTLSAGTRQSLAALSLPAGIEVLDVPRNFAADGTTVGKAITLRERDYFDEMFPDWHSVTGASVEHWFFDPRDPKAFYVYPALTGNGKVELIYSANPADLAALADVITLDDTYANALQFFVLFSFFSKDANYAKSLQMAASYWGMFMQALGIRDKNVLQAAASGAARAAAA